jgi:alkyl sulfatase BDS1-like metallo-beta-lactamase superfamily hydrolase
VGAKELPEGPPASREVRRGGLVQALTIEQAFEAIGVRLKSENVGGQHVLINWHFTDVDERWILGLQNRTLHSIVGRHAADAAATVTLTKSGFLSIIAGSATFLESVTSGEITIEGDATALVAVFGNLDTFASGFNIIEP